jgi:hypothetical protein
MEEQNQNSEENLVQQLPSQGKKLPLKEILIPVIAILLIIGAGTFTGYFISKKGSSLGGTTSKELIGGAEVIEGPQEVGIKDEAAFRDTAQGRIEANGNGEGSHKLLRPGGESQTAYLTSSVLDLDQFVGRCVQVWGETFAAQSVGWLMDVGRVKTLDSCPEGI